MLWKFPDLALTNLTRLVNQDKTKIDQSSEKEIDSSLPLSIFLMVVSVLLRRIGSPVPARILSAIVKVYKNNQIHMFGLLFDVL